MNRNDLANILPINLDEIIPRIADALDIEQHILRDIITNKINIVGINSTRLVNELIAKLLQNDKAINEFGNHITSETTKEKYKNLKRNLGKLQVLILIDKLKQSNNCDDVLNTFISAINNKLENLVELENIKYSQQGGSNINDNYSSYKKNQRYIKHLKYIKCLLYIIYLKNK